ncbi:group 1 glycosyl transferase [Pseudalgibacter alginicilyticus]|uniref:Group 1 glycosyl transferase n=1 Tax=Pseudalgibacter alginicilyticus TaxID=1736674 RepID=A0A0N7HY89_9FLAO|nr:glycosyltransferase family 4 protein [Pseudalgibacter alginicilyticus]ALJ04582.1 group 1 glycosyl transferase [Pseudalgibacter alginicilyticus]
MDVKPKRIAIICNYELLESRVGGMDYFFWAFNEKCIENQIKIDWFFPNKALHGNYKVFNIFPSENKTLETTFISYIKKNQVQYSHIVTHFLELCTSFFSEVKKHQTAKIIGVDHNPRPLNGYPLKKRFKKRLKGILYSKYIDLFVGVSIYTSHAILNDFGSFLKSKTQTIYNGVLMNSIISKTTERSKLKPKFLVVSHLRFSKGIQDLIEAVNLLSEDLKADLKIDVYGDGPYKNRLSELVSAYKLEANLNFKGSQSNVNELYQNYDYLIQPTHMECFSLSVLESLSANIPVITTPVGGNLEVISNNENGFIFETKNFKVLAALLSSIIRGEKGITINTRKLIENRFSIEMMVQKHIELLK